MSDYYNFPDLDSPPPIRIDAPRGFGDNCPIQGIAEGLGGIATARARRDELNRMNSPLMNPQTTTMPND